jgi:hypothetical protein
MVVAEDAAAALGRTSLHQIEDTHLRVEHDTYAHVVCL